MGFETLVWNYEYHKWMNDVITTKLLLFFFEEVLNYYLNLNNPIFRRKKKTQINNGFFPH